MDPTEKNTGENQTIKKLSIVIVSWNTRDLLRGCLQSVYDTMRRDDFEVIVVDNNSTDGSQAMVKTEFPRVRPIENSENKGFPIANNQGMFAAKGEYLLCLNPDTVVYPGTIDRVMTFLDENPDFSAAGCRIRLPDGSYQTAAAKLFTPLDKAIIYGFSTYLHRAGIIKKHPYENTKYPDDYLSSVGVVDYMIGAFIMIRRELLDAVGGLDPVFFFCVDDLDWGLRINTSGRKMRHLTDCEILHIANQSGKQIDRTSTEFRGSAHFWKKHYGLPGRLLFDYFRITLALRERSARLLEKLNLTRIRRYVFALLMAVSIPIEMLLLIPLTIRHRRILNKMPSTGYLRAYANR